MTNVPTSPFSNKTSSPDTGAEIDTALARIVDLLARQTAREIAGGTLHVQEGQHAKQEDNT